MARLAATASLAVLLLSLLAFATCRTLEGPEHDNAVAVAVPDEHGPPNPADVDDGDAEVIPSVAVGEGFLRLPSHRRHRVPCRHGQGFHRHLWWAHHHGLFHRRVHPGPGAVVAPTELEAEHEEEVKAVAEPDPDSHPDTDGEQAEDAVVEEEANKPFHGEEEHNEGMVKAWKREMLRRFHSHHHHRHHHEQNEQDGDDDDHEERKGGMKRFRFHHHRHHHEEAEAIETRNNKSFFHHGDVDEVVDEVEELARRLSKAIMRRRFGGHGHRHHHHHAEEEAENEEGGVKTWFKRLMNRF